MYLKTFEDLDCYVSISTGEGFSIQPREAMALGIPAVLTNNTAQSTICDSNLVRKVTSSIEIPAFNVGFNNYYGVCYDCKQDDVAHALRDIYDNYDHYLQQGAQARAWVKQYCYSELRPLYVSLVKPQHIILGQENKLTAHSLTTDSPELFEKYQRLLK